MKNTDMSEITAILEYIVIVTLTFQVSQNYVVNIFITKQATLKPLQICISMHIWQKVSKNTLTLTDTSGSTYISKRRVKGLTVQGKPWDEQFSWIGMFVRIKSCNRKTIYIWRQQKVWKSEISYFANTKLQDWKQLTTYITSATESRLPVSSTQNPAFETTLQQHEVFTCPLKRLMLPASVLQTFMAALAIMPLLVIFIYFSGHKAETAN